MRERDRRMDVRKIYAVYSGDNEGPPSEWIGFSSRKKAAEYAFPWHSIFEANLTMVGKAGPEHEFIPGTRLTDKSREKLEAKMYQIKCAVEILETNSSTVLDPYLTDAIQVLTDEVERILVKLQ